MPHQRFPDFFKLLKDSEEPLHEHIDVSILAFVTRFMAIKSKYLSGTVIRGTPTLLNTTGNHHQHKPQRLMGAVQVKASSTKGHDLASPEPGLE
jgi:hypothetical protein